jgi:hypothetical protein
MGAKRIEPAQTEIEQNNNNLTDDFFRQGEETFPQYAGIFLMLTIGKDVASRGLADVVRARGADCRHY